MSGNAGPAPAQPAPAKAAKEPSYSVAIRPDGWPDLLGLALVFGVDPVPRSGGRRTSGMALDPRICKL